MSSSFLIQNIIDTDSGEDNSSSDNEEIPPEAITSDSSSEVEKDSTESNRKYIQCCSVFYDVTFFTRHNARKR